MKPFKLTKDMHEEMLDGIKTLADTDTDDTVGPSPFAKGLRKRDVHLSNSEGDAPGPKDHQEVVAEDPINPSHYRRHPSGIECIEVTRHLNFNVGNAIKYIWRYQDKGDPVENLKKAQWYLDDEIRRLQGSR